MSPILNALLTGLLNVGAVLAAIGVAVAIDAQMEKRQLAREKDDFR